MMVESEVAAHTAVWPAILHQRSSGEDGLLLQLNRSPVPRDTLESRLPVPGPILFTNRGLESIRD